MKRSITARVVFFYGFVICLFFLGFWLHVWQLSAVPVALTYDELDYVINGWSYAKTGQDLLSQRQWYTPGVLETGALTSELGAHWHILTGLVNWSDPVIGARIPSVISGILASLLTGYVGWLLFKSKKIALITGLFLFISPWGVVIFRSGYEVAIAVVWQLIGLVGLLKLLDTKSRRKAVIWTVVAVAGMSLAFYSYHAFKFSSLAVVMFFAIYCFWLEKSKLLTSKYSFRGILVVLGAVLMMILSFVLGLQDNVVGERQGEIVLFNKDYLSQQVDGWRQIAIDTPLESEIFNKPFAIVMHIFSHLGTSLNPGYLFINSGDTSVASSLYGHGYLYLIFAPLIIIGVVWGWNKHRLKTLIVFGVMSSALLPVVIQTSFSAVLRGGIFFPMLVLLSGMGFIRLWNDQGRWLKAGAYFVSLLIVWQGFWFGYWYFWLYPIRLADSQANIDRVLAAYLSHVDSPITVIATNPRSWLRTTAFYSGWLKSKSILEVKKSVFEKLLSDDVSYGLIEYTDSCPATGSGQSSVAFDVDHKVTCGVPESKDQNTLTSILSSPWDNRAYFYIFNDRVCDDFTGVPFVNIKNHSQLQPEKLSREEFCQTWVRKEVN